MTPSAPAFAIARTCVGRLTPNPTATGTGGPALAAAMRVVDWVHGNAPVVRLLAQPPLATGLAVLDVLVFGVTHLTDGCLAENMHLADLARRELDLGVVAFLRNKLRPHACAADHLRAFAGAKLDVVDNRARRDLVYRHGVPGKDVSPLTGDDRLAHAETVGTKDVTFFAVGVVEEGEACGTVGIVLDGRHLGGYPVLVSLEIDDAVSPLVAASAKTDGEASARVAPSRFVERFGQRFFGTGLRDLLERRSLHEAPAGSGGGVGLESHGDCLPIRPRGTRSSSGPL